MNNEDPNLLVRGETMKQQQAEMGQLQQEVSQYTAGLLPPIPEPPQTFVIECNKTLAQLDGDSEFTHSWTNSFPPLKLKKGDIVSVNSAFLSTRGSGDLLQFDDSNNAVRILFEYYATNDNANNKKGSINIQGATAGTYPNAGSYVYNKDSEIPCHPVNYRPMPLKRLMPTYQTAINYYANALIPSIPQYTSPTTALPFFSQQKEAYWGYQNSDDFILDSVEDYYVGGLFRTPELGVRELMVDATTPEVAPPVAGDIEDMFGIQTPDLRIWYVSNQNSLLGACNTTATMRIYFFYSTLPTGDTPMAEMIDTLKLLRTLRTGEIIQFKNTNMYFGSNAGPSYGATGVNTFTTCGGSNAYYCSGYANLQTNGATNGITVNGNTVDKFTQVGRHVDTAKYDMSAEQVMGQLMKITKINIGNYGNTATVDATTGVLTNPTDNPANGKYPNYVYNLATYGTNKAFAGAGDKWQNGTGANDLAKAISSEVWDYMPWIEVECEKSISLCFGNPNLNHPDGVVSMGLASNDQLTIPTTRVDIDNFKKFCSNKGQIELRTWYAEANSPLEVIPKNADLSGTPTDMISKLGRRWSKQFPSNPHDSQGVGVNEKMYITYKPNYYSPADPPAGLTVDEIAHHFRIQNMKNSYTTQVDENIPVTPTLGFYDNFVGYGGPNPSLLIPNYNITTLDKDAIKEDPDAEPWDTKTDGFFDKVMKGYAGARVPNWLNGPKGNADPDRYDEPVATITRTGFHNQGQSVFPQAIGVLDNSGKFMNATYGRQGQGVDIDYRTINTQSAFGQFIQDPLNGPAEPPVFFNEGGVGTTADDRAGWTATTDLEPDSDLMLRSGKDKPIKFYFSTPISPSSVYRGKDLSGELLNGVNPTGYAGPSSDPANFPTRDAMRANAKSAVDSISGLSWARLTARPALLDGSYNFCCGAKNMPPPIYSDRVASPAGTALPPTNETGALWYGYSGENNIMTTGAVTVRSPTIEANKPDYLPDLRFLFGQLEDCVYARFTNIDPTTKVKTSEVMYIKLMPYPVCNNPNLEKVSPQTLSATEQADREFYHPSIIYMPTEIPNVGTLNCNFRCSVGFLILARDCEGTGAKSFTNTYIKKLAPTFSFDPTQAGHTQQLWEGSSNTTKGLISNELMRDHWDDTQSGECYFEILNGFSMVEHQLAIDNPQRDILPLSQQNFTDNERYLRRFGSTNVSGDTPPVGLGCGGDFYITKVPNMPIVVTNPRNNEQVYHISDAMIRLCSNRVRKGPPTEVLKKNKNLTHQGNLSWQTHYDYIDLSVAGDKVYFSPSDIANIITKQLHKPADLYKSVNVTTAGTLLVKEAGNKGTTYQNPYAISKGGGRYSGGTWEDTAGLYPVNSLFRPIHGPSRTTIVNGAKQNDWNTTNGQLNGLYSDGDFCFHHNYTTEVEQNMINSYGYIDGKLMDNTGDQDNKADLPTSGLKHVWIQNNAFYLNTLPTTDHYRLKGYNYSETSPSSTCRTFYDETDYSNGFKMTDANINAWVSSTFGSIFAGTNNATLNYNTDISRFEWKFFHQPVYSTFTTGTDGATNGGNIVAKIWGQSVKGMDNWDRYGGVNVVNWCMPKIALGQGKTRRDALNLGSANPLTGVDTIGNAFLKKLGFSDLWQQQNSGSTDYEDVKNYTNSKCYKPNGTTRSDYDISQAKPYTQVNPLLNAMNATDTLGGTFRGVKNIDTPLPTTPVDADYVKQRNLYSNDTSNISLGGKVATYDSSVVAPALTSGGRQSYNGVAPYGVGQQDAPTRTPTVTKTTLKTIGATLGYGMTSSLATPPSVIYGECFPARSAGDLAGIAMKAVKGPISLNMDDVKFPNFEVEVDSSALTADELPKKTVIGYFLIMSDIIDKHEFIGSANNGSPLNCIGILSKNYENNDFYFSFQSPVEFHIKQDRTITQIKTSILTPTLTIPPGLDKNHSIIYTIQRQNTIPEADVPPVSIQQALDYATMEQMTSQLGIDMNMFNPTSAVGQMGIGNSGGANLNSLRQSLVSAVLQPNSHSAQTIAHTESSMLTMVSRMPLHERTRAIQQAGMGNPADALKPNIAEAQMEGLGIAQPTQKEPAPYLSTEQLQIEDANYRKGRRDSSSSSIGDSGVGGNEIPDLHNVPLDPVADDDDIRSMRSNMTKDQDLFSQIDPSEIGMNPQQLFAEADHNSRQGASKGLQAVSLPEFFSRYMNVANEQTRQLYRQEADQHGFSVDNPNVWRLGVLRNWTGKDNDFNWGTGMYKKIGATLNLEARSKLLQAKGRYESLSKSDQRIQRGKEVEDIKQRGEDPTSLVIPEPAFGQESLSKRISRSYPRDGKTRMDEKHLHATDFTGQNPYDLRTWSAPNLEHYQKDLHHGVLGSQKNQDNKLSKSALDHLRTEQKRRKDGGNLRKLQLDGGGNYKKGSEEPRRYDPHLKHKTPHSSIGEEGQRYKISKKYTGIKAEEAIKWKNGSIREFALDGGSTTNDHHSHESAIKEARKHEGKVSGITRYKHQGLNRYRLGKGEGKFIVTAEPNKHQHYMFKDIGAKYPNDTKTTMKPITQTHPVESK